MPRLAYKSCVPVKLRATLCPALLLLAMLAAVPAALGQSAAAAEAWPRPLLLWPQGAPGALGLAEVDRPRLYPFLPEKRSTLAAVLIIPGGGYQIVALGHEGFQVAQWLNAQGIAAFVLDYRVAPYKFPVPIDDGRRAMRLIRAHATEWGIDPDRLGVWGFSAGGHLASSLGTHCGLGNPEDPDPVNHLDCRPDFLILAYPVITMREPGTHGGSRTNLLGAHPDPALVEQYSNELAVTAQTPPSFLFATTNDPTVPIENSLDFYRALERARVPAEMHLYDYANHGCGLCGNIPELSTWPGLLRNWLVHTRMLPADAPPPPVPGPNMPVWPAGLEGPGR